MRSFFSLVCLAATAALAGCYQSHRLPVPTNDAGVPVESDAGEMPADDAGPMPEPDAGQPPIGCLAESADPVARFETVSAPAAITIPAGSRDAVVASFRLTDARVDLETAEYPYLFSAYPGYIMGGIGSLTTPHGGPVFMNARLVVEERTTLYGPYDIIDDGDDTEVEYGEFWDANLLRAGREFIFTFLVDVAEDAVAGGDYYIRLGDECTLSPRFWYVYDDGTTEMPIEEIGGNHPITIRVTIAPSR